MSVIENLRQTGTKIMIIIFSGLKLPPPKLFLLFWDDDTQSNRDYDWSERLKEQQNWYKYSTVVSSMKLCQFCRINSQWQLSSPDIWVSAWEESVIYQCMTMSESRVWKHSRSCDMSYPLCLHLFSLCCSSPSDLQDSFVWLRGSTSCVSCVKSCQSYSSDAGASLFCATTY